MLKRDLALAPALAGVENFGAHPHNFYLQVAYEWGVPAALLLVGVLGFALLRLAQAVHQTTDTTQKNVGMALFAGVLAVCVDGCFSGNFVMPMSQLWIALLFGLALNWLKHQVPHELPHQPPQSFAPSAAYLRYATASGFLLLALMQPSILFPEVLDLNAYLNHVMQDIAPRPIYNPRFWSHGWS